MVTILVTIISFFAAAVLISVVMTPLARKAGRRYGALDVPDDRKIHTVPIPRIGGLAIFVSFFLVFGGALFFAPALFRNQLFDSRYLFFALGSLVAFGIGTVDDFRRINPKIKLLFQICAAAIPCYGGLGIEAVGIGSRVLHLGVYSYAVTIFWFVLLMNAINLIDGLDGLAAGIVFFASLVMVVLTFYRRDYATALVFAVLAGTLLGFLRYNFNPASIFMGDGGSYFLGYAVAGISIIGSIKSQTGALILIPLVSMGLPVFDAILSPVRRFVLGNKMFQPDKSHIHHRIVSLGFTPRNAVLVIYGISVVLCILGILVANIRDELIGLFLVVLAASSILFFKKLRYFEYFALDKVYGWLKDITDVTGISKDRRSFLSIQIEIGNSGNIGEMWERVSIALEMIRFDRANLVFHDPSTGGEGLRWELSPGKPEGGNGSDLKIELPLFNGKDNAFGVLTLRKNLRVEPLNMNTIRRVEHLRRSIETAIGKMQQADAVQGIANSGAGKSEEEPRDEAGPNLRQ